MKLTLFVDASFCPNTKAAGWGSWSKRDGWDRGRFDGGQLVCPLNNSTAAELCGIACAVWALHAGGHLLGVSVMMIQCDNIIALGLMQSVLPQGKASGSGNARDTQSLPAPRLAKLGKSEHEALEVIRMALADVPVYLRHVKGHSNDDTGRSWVNTQCDAEARRHMEKRRRNLRRKKSAATERCATVESITT